MMADEIEDREREKRRDVMRGSPRIEETPKVKRRKERSENEDEEDDEKRLMVPKEERELQPIKLDGVSILRFSQIRYLIDQLKNVKLYII